MPSDQLHIRRFKTQDADDIISLCLQLGYTIDHISLNNTMKAIEHGKNDVVLVGTLESNLIAWIHAFIAYRVESTPFVEIGGLIVDELFRGHGVGAKLMEAIQIWSKEHNVSQIRVRSNYIRKSAHQFYEDLGFVKMKNQKVFYLKI